VWRGRDPRVDRRRGTSGARPSRRYSQPGAAL